MAGQEEQGHGRRDRPRHHGRRVRQEPGRRRLARGRLRHQRGAPPRGESAPASRSPRAPPPSPRRCRRSSPACPSRRRSWTPCAPSPPPSCRARLLVEMSTFAISDKEKAARVLAKAGHAMLDTPVSGTGAQAKTRDLVFYASGDAAAHPAAADRCSMPSAATSTTSAHSATAAG